MERGITLSLQRIASSASQVLAAFVASAPPRGCDLRNQTPAEPQGSAVVLFGDGTVSP